MKPEPEPRTTGDFVVYLDDQCGASRHFLKCASWLVRIALAASFASAVADRFGFWGLPGTPGVAWGDMERFNAYLSKLNWFLPVASVGIIGWIATLAETLLAVALLLGWRLRWAALVSAILLLLFALAMAAALGAKAALDYSVFTAASAAFLLFVIQPTKPKRQTP